MAEPHLPDPTFILNAACSGDRDAIHRLFPLVYDQLRKAAQLDLASERRDHTLSATALVHEAYLKLIGPRELPWQNRAHFYAAAAQAMRQILVDHARSRATAKRGGPTPQAAPGAASAGAHPHSGRAAAKRAALNLASLPDLSDPEENDGFLILEAALSRLEGVDDQAAAVVRLRYFAGLSVEQTAAALGVSAPTVKRAWAFARGWLKDAIETERG